MEQDHSCHLRAPAARLQEGARRAEPHVPADGRDAVGSSKCDDQKQINTAITLWFCRLVLILYNQPVYLLPSAYLSRSDWFKQRSATCGAGVMNGTRTRYRRDRKDILELQIAFIFPVRSLPLKIQHKLKH